MRNQLLVGTSEFLQGREQNLESIDVEIPCPKELTIEPDKPDAFAVLMNK